MFFGGTLAWVIALGQLVRPPLPKNYFLSLLLFCVGFWQNYLALLYSNQILNYPFLYNAMGPFVFFTGPLFYLYITLVIDESRIIRKRWIWHFIPGILAGLYLAPITYHLNTDKFQTFLELRKESRVGPIKQLLVLAVFLDMVYVLYLGRKIRGLFSREYLVNPKMRHILFFVLQTILVIILFFLAIVLENETLGRLSGGLVTFAMIYIYMLSQRYPDLIHYLSSEKKKYERSQLAGIDIEKVRLRLKQLMEEEKVFCDEDLDLKTLAENLEITPHQLSEFLNQKLDTNFKSFLKTYRIEEAKKLLFEEKERTTLSIGYAVGFNSNSAFHSAFRQATGMTPAKYRKGGSRGGDSLSK